MPTPDCNLVTLTGALDPNCSVTEVLLPNGRAVRLDTLLLLSTETGTDPFQPIDRTLNTGAEEIVPIIEERLIVGKQIVETGKVRLVKSVGEYQEALNEPLAVRTFDIERIALNQPVESAPAVRHEGTTTIYPVVEEQLVLTKRLILKEEVRVTQRDTERRDTQVVTLRREHITVERESKEPRTS